MNLNIEDLVSVNWKLQDKNNGLLGYDVLPTNNLTIQSIKTMFDGKVFVWFTDRITCPVDSRRIYK